MKPYYENENGKLYCGKCEDYLPYLRADLILTDPPYGIGEAAGKNKSRSKITTAKDYGNDSWDDKIPDKKIFDLMFEISKNQIIFGGNYFIEYLKNSPCWLVWDKDNGKSDFADCELVWTNFETAVRKFKYRWAGMLQENGGKYKEKRFHPTQKPVGLYKQILLKYSKPNQTVLDCFSGSGTLALACEDVGNLKWIMIEDKEKYCEISAKRIESETKQMKLF